MTLDSLLSEVGPILGSSQFSHPSFREVLAARQLAEEINSGKLSVKQAANAVWLYDPGEDMARIQDEYFDDLYPGNIEFDPSHVMWKSVLAHMAAMLNADKAKEFVDVVGEFHAKRIGKGAIIRKKEALSSLVGDSQLRQYHAVVDDMILCAKFIEAHPTSVKPKGYSKQILDTLLCAVKNFIDEPDLWTPEAWQPIELQAVRSLDALAKTKSSYVLQKLIAYVDGRREMIVQGLSYYFQENVLEHDVLCTVKKLALSGVKVSEEFLVNYFQECTGRYGRDCRYVFDLVGSLGGLKCLEGLIDLLPCWFRRGKDYYFPSIFNIIRRHDFDPDMIRKFNDGISKVSDGKLRTFYNGSLRDFADKVLEDHNVNLYDHLEAKGVQFFDSEVYKPK